MTSAFTPRILSGAQPTGALHIGNYLGAVKNYAILQKEFPESLYFIADCHAVTVGQDPEALRKSVRLTAAMFVAAGVDPEKSAIFNQSRCDAHVKLAWVFNCVARTGWLNRMTQFKEKAGKNREQASVGLYTYPVLMAADILCYKATHVPVGEDQKQHLELARDIAVRFNLEHAKSDFFPLPEPVTPKETARVMSLRDGNAKMSKSDPSDNARINLNDEDDVIAQKIKKAKTDGGLPPATLEDLESRAEIHNLYKIYAALTEKPVETVIDGFADKNFSAFKTALTEILVETVRPFRAEMGKVLTDTQYIDDILTRGAEKARAIADPIVSDVYEIFGFLR